MRDVTMFPVLADASRKIVVKAVDHYEIALKGIFLGIRGAVLHACVFT